jgi:hypothetical protein
LVFHGQEGVDDYVLHARDQIFVDVNVHTFSILRLELRAVQIFLEVLVTQCVAFLVSPIHVFVLDLQTLIGEMRG